MPKRTDEALDALCVAVERSQDRLQQVLARAAVLRAGRAEGRAYSDLVSEEDRPLLVELLTEVMDELAAAGAVFRRAEARALHDDGMSQEAIAHLFGVTRQRVGVLLQNAARG
jgi:predicted XRE-type DNA-binding protein